MAHIILDKIGSVAKNAGLKRTVEVGETIICEDGALLVAQVLTEKKIYNKLELPSGRMSLLQKGDVIAVALGNRRALKGYVGDVPKNLCVGDTIHLLNIGGVAGICRSASLNEVGQPMKLKVLGAILDRGKPTNIRQYRLFGPQKKLPPATPPLIIISGTCMNVGKTSLAAELLKFASRDGKNFCAAKVTGIASLKDIQSMHDAGALAAVSFVDAGYTSTISPHASPREIAKGIINHLTQYKPDAIVLEFGDGIYGEYGVEFMLKDKEIQKHSIAHLGCAHDPVGAMKLKEICASIGCPLTLISGPVTDNSIGIDFVSDHLALPAFNALTDGDALYTYITQHCLFTPT